MEKPINYECRAASRLRKPFKPTHGYIVCSCQRYLTIAVAYHTAVNFSLDTAIPLSGDKSILLLMYG